MNLKVCFIGVGSIAKRHIRNLTCICDSRNYNLQVDIVRHSKHSEKLESELLKDINSTFYSMEDLPNDYDIIFITNPTKYHAETLKKVNEKATHFFIEKPITSLDMVQEVMNFQKKMDGIYYVACPLRYSAVIQYIKKEVPLNDVISVRSISSSYLPNWRPGRDYRNIYSAHKEMGGGVDIDLIHEWDYLVYLFGNPNNCYVIKGKKSDLEIDSDDFAVYIAEYKQMAVELHLDYFGRKTIREIMLMTKDDTIVGDLVENRVTFLKENKQIDFKEERNSYQIREMEHFLNLIIGKEMQEQSDIEHAIKVLELTQGRV